jgi:hypothetical protein
MKTRTVIAGNIALLLLATTALQAADQTIIFSARPGSKMRIEGTANAIHTTWFMDSPMIGGMLEVGPSFPTEPGQAATPGKIEASGKAFIPVNSLKSVEEDGKPYNEDMDRIAYEHMKEDKFRQINYKLTELVLKEAPKSKDAPYVFDSTGDLTIAGVTKTIKMPVSILPLADPKGKMLQVTGSVTVKTPDFGVEIVDKNLVIAHIKTGEEVKLVFKWMLGQKKAAASAAK